MMCCELRSAARASGRSKPWVSEMTPMTMGVLSSQFSGVDSFRSELALVPAIRTCRLFSVLPHYDGESLERRAWGRNRGSLAPLRALAVPARKANPARQEYLPDTSHR